MCISKQFEKIFSKLFGNMEPVRAPLSRRTRTKMSGKKKMVGIGKKVLIRSYGSGVHFGTLVSEQFTEAGKVVILENSRRIHRWTGACSCSQIATDGISGDRVSVVVPLIEVVNVIETIPLSEKAIDNLENQPVWKS